MADVLGDSFTSYWEDLPSNRTGDRRFLSTNEWVIQNRLDRDTGDEFASWEDYFRSTSAYRGDNFTKVERYNPTDGAFIREASGIHIEDMDVSDNPPYAAEDILILSDGLCSSSCAMFMEMMHHEAQVRTVAVGGRPDYTPMQAPAGTRGAASYNIGQMDLDIYNALRINNATPPSLPDRTLAFFLYSASVNLRDQIRREDPSNTPLQFRYEAADCRIFFTPKTWYNYTELWNYAAEATWHNPALCIAKSTTNYTSPRPTPYQVDITRPDGSSSSGTPSEQSTWEQDYDQDDYYTNDPANDILAVQHPIGPVDGKKCTTDFNCGGPFLCREVPVCDEYGQVKNLRRCAAKCGNQRGTCSRGSCKPEKQSLQQALRVDREWPLTSGYCVPPRPICRQAEPDNQDLGLLVTELPPAMDDICKANLPEYYSLDCFPYGGGFQKCYSWYDDRQIRYCTNEQLDELERQWTNYGCSTSEDYGSVCWDLDKPSVTITRHQDESKWLAKYGSDFESSYPY